MYISNSNIGIFTASVFVKYSGRQYFGIRIYNDDGTKYALKLYDVLNGTLGTQNVAGLGATSSITSVGNGWYRCVLTIDTSIINSNLLFFLADTNTITDAGGTTYTGNGSGVYLWGAQLVEGTQPLDYLATTNRLNIPRINYSQGVGCLLLEPQRTNLVLRSEKFDSASWINTAVSTNASSSLSPSGSGSFKIIPNTTNTNHFIQQSVSVVLGTTYTMSFFAKADGYNFTSTFISALGIGVSWDLQNGTAGTGGSIINYGNGWYRCIATGVATTTGIASFRIYAQNSSISSFAGNGIDGVLAWGAQLEEGAYATSYIPTTSASVTRIADTFSRSNIYTDGLISSAGGTWVVELRNNLSLVRDNSANGLMLSKAQVYNDSFRIRNAGTGRFSIHKTINASDVNIYTTTTDSCKIAIRWNGTTGDLFVNGSKVVSNFSFTETQLQYLDAQISDAPRYIKSMSLYNAPLSDSECAQITSDIKN